MSTLLENQDKGLELIFETVKAHLLTQMQKSSVIDEDGENHLLDCLYRSSEGLACAVGCLISDDVYESELEGLSADNAQVLEAVIRSNPFLADVDRKILVNLLTNLQFIHDSINVVYWPNILSNLKFSDVLMPHYYCNEIIRELQYSTPYKEN